MSKRRRIPGGKHSKVRKLPVRRTSAKALADKKLSAIIKEMTLRLLKDAEAAPSEPATMATLMVAGAACNCAIGENPMHQNHCELIEQAEVICLEGLPDIPGGHPHSRLKS